MQIILAFLVFFSLAADLKAQEASGGLQARLQQIVSRALAKNEVEVGISVVRVADGSSVFEYKAEKLLSPASVMKVLTSATALKVLGPEYQFPSEIFTEVPPRISGKVGNLYFRGHGDPSLVSERLWKLAVELAERGVKEVDGIVIDNSLFVDPLSPTGPDPYQAGSSATAFNFNALAININRVDGDIVVRLTPGSGYVPVMDKVRQKKKGKERTPLSMIIKPASLNEHGFWAKAGEVVISGDMGAQDETIYRSLENPEAYLGFALAYSLESAGIKVRGRVGLGKVPPSAEKVYTWKSPEISEILRDLNRFSNNFSANQVLFHLGQGEDGRYSLARGTVVLGRFLQTLGIPSSAYDIYDGSGLDKRDKLTPAVVTRVLSWAAGDFSVAPYFVSSLSRFGASGTLRKRDLKDGGVVKVNSFTSFDPSQAVWGKTGTFNGVSSLAGYAASSSGEILAFALFINSMPSKDWAKDFEERVVSAIIRP